MRADYAQIKRKLISISTFFSFFIQLWFLKNNFFFYALTVFKFLFRSMCVNPHFCYEYLIARHFLDSLYVSEMA